MSSEELKGVAFVDRDKKKVAVNSESEIHIILTLNFSQLVSHTVERRELRQNV